MEKQNITSTPWADLRPLVKGDVIQRGDIFTDDGQSFEMSRSGVVLGVQCLGQTIRKDNGGWYRPITRK
jgi:hypothetical protein